MNIKDVGTAKFVNERYATKGRDGMTPAKTVEHIVSNESVTAAARHFEVSRKQIWVWIRNLKSERKNGLQ